MKVLVKSLKNASEQRMFYVNVTLRASTLLAPWFPLYDFGGPEKGRFFGCEEQLQQLMFKVAAVCIDTSPEPLPESKDGLVDWRLRQISPDDFQHRWVQPCFGAWACGSGIFLALPPRRDSQAGWDQASLEAIRLWWWNLGCFAPTIPASDERRERAHCLAGRWSRGALHPCSLPSALAADWSCSSLRWFWPCLLQNAAFPCLRSTLLQIPSRLERTLLSALAGVEDSHPAFFQWRYQLPVL